MYYLFIYLLHKMRRNCILELELDFCILINAVVIFFKTFVVFSNIKRVLYVFLHILYKKKEIYIYIKTLKRLFIIVKKTGDVRYTHKTCSLMV